MSSQLLFLALVAGYIGIVLGWSAFGDSLRAAARVVSRLGRRHHFAGALALLAIVGLTAVAVAGRHDSGSRAKVNSKAALKPPSADPARLRPSRALSQPVRVQRPRARHVQRPRARHTEKHAKVVSNLVSVSAHVTPPARPTGPAPLPAPAESSPPSPLAAP